MKTETLDKLNAALDAIWIEVGNGYATKYERFISELQTIIEYETSLRIEAMKCHSSNKEISNNEQ